MLADSGCRVLITMTGFGGLDYQSMLDRVTPRPTVVLLDTDGRARAELPDGRRSCRIGR